MNNEHDDLDKRTVGEILRNIENRLAVIELQVTRTNGRVSSLEKWKYGLVVGLSTLALAKWPMLIPLLNHLQP